MKESSDKPDRRREAGVKRRKYTGEQDAAIAARRLTGESLPSLMREFGGSLPSMRASLRRSGISPLRTGRPRWREFTPGQTTEMIAMWEAGSSQRAIAIAFSTDQGIVSRLIRQAGHVPVRRYSHARGEKHGSWRGGRINLTGYPAVLVEPGSLFESMASRIGYVLEHRLIVAQALNRPLRSTETVHHINGVKDDNRLENLQLRQGKHGAGEVMRCLDCDSYNVGPVPIKEIPT